MDITGYIFPDLDQLSRAAADFFVEAAGQAVRQRGRALIALSGGSTPLRLFRLLAEPPFSTQVPWATIHFFWCDERCVPADHPESNFGQANRLLFEPLGLAGSHLHRVLGELPAVEAATAYAETLREYAQPPLLWPAFDLALLGLGADGHTASLFPGRPIPADAPVLAVTADYQGRPAERVTLTPLVLNQARRVLFLVSGREKTVAAARTLFGPPDPALFPAQRIRPVEGTVAWYLEDIFIPAGEDDPHHHTRQTP